MRKEIYDTLSEKERVMYEELVSFAKRLTERMEEMALLLKAILSEADK